MKASMNKFLFFLLIIAIACSPKSDLTETYRPQVHYTPAKNWVNDPNGLVYLDGEYHLFYQYNPEGNVWGHMSWGHAVSTDLQNWEELQVALPEIINSDGTIEGIFSGSAVVDSLNTSGFFEPGFKNGLLAIYTANVTKGEEQIGQNQGIAYSSDKGHTWTYYDQNPVLDIGLKDFRDPNVFRYKGKWKMVVSVPLEFKVQIYESDNLKSWSLLSEFGKMGDTAKIWECPSLFPVPVENSTDQKWVMMVSSAGEDIRFTGMQYFVGDFDGKTFTADKQEGVKRIDYGKDFYAAIPFNNLPQSKKNPVIMGWINDWEYARDIPTVDFRGSFSFPRKLSLIKNGDDFQLNQVPVVSSSIPLKSEKLQISDLKKALEWDMADNTYHLNLEIDLAGSNGFQVALLKHEKNETVITYTVNDQILSLDRTQSGRVDFNEKFPSIEKMKVIPVAGKILLDIYLDQHIIELYANGGQKVLTDMVFPTSQKGKVIISFLETN